MNRVRILLAATMTAAVATAQIRVHDLRPGTPNGNPTELTRAGSDIYFVANDSRNRSYLYRFGPGVGGAVPLLDGNPEQLAAVGNDLYFSSTAQGSGRELWRADATGVRRVADRPNGSAAPRWITGSGGVVLYTAVDGRNGRELWEFDPTANTARLAANVHPNASSNPQHLTRFGSRCVFAAADGTHGIEPWIYDPATGSARLLRDVRIGSGSLPDSFTVAGSKVFFVANDGAGRELWETDGSTAGTQRVVLAANLVGLAPDELVAVGSDLYFVGRERTNGAEVWRVRGSAASLVWDHIAGNNSARPDSLVASGPNLYFRARRPGAGWELSVFDTTSPPSAVNPRVVQDLDPGNDHGLPTAGRIAAVSPGAGRGVIFAGREDPVTGIEPYVHDGTGRPAQRLAIINPLGDSNPRLFVASTSWICFAASHPTRYGTELFYAPAGATNLASWSNFGSACAGSVGNLPRMAANSLPSLGNASFRVEVTNQLPGSPTVFVFSLPGARSTLGRCRFEVDLGGLIVLPLTTADAVGAASFSVPIAMNSALLGVQMFSQALSRDQGGQVLGLASLSDGLSIVLGR